MKRLLTVVMAAMLTCNLGMAKGPGISEVLKILSEIKNQHNEGFDPDRVSNEILLICVEGTQNSFLEIYSKLRHKQLKQGVQVVAGWGKVMPDMPKVQKLSHINQGFTSEQGLGENGYSILMDANSNVFKLLELDQYSLVWLSKQTGKVTIKSFGSNRPAFIKEMRKYFN
jgi:hypothetical protein